MEGALLVCAVLAVLGFAWVNGFHDASNAVATSLATGALTPAVALGLAAVLNAAGAMLGITVAQTVATALLRAPVSHLGLVLVLAALLSAVSWGVLTWWFGMPSSSSHALLGGLAGAGLAVGVRVDGGVLLRQLVLPTLLSPLIGLLAAWALVLALGRVFRDAAHGKAMRRFRMAQTVSASAMALGHGIQDGQKVMGVAVLALISAGSQAAGDGVPLWVRVAVALALGVGTAYGGWRVIRTLGRGIVHIDPVTGFAAETVSAAILYTAAGVFAAPVSSTHTVAAAILGAGGTRGRRAVRWGVVRRVGVTWLLTPLVTAGLAAAVAAGLALVL